MPGRSRVREAWLQRASAPETPTLATLLSGAQAPDPPALRTTVDPRVWCWTWMRFLCDEERRTPDFDPRWALIPERYAVGWLTRGDEEKARAFALEGLDRAALERAWLASLK